MRLNRSKLTQQLSSILFGFKSASAGTMVQRLSPVFFKISIAPFLLSLSVSVVAQGQEKFHSNPQAGINYYLDTYGQAPPGSLPDVYEVFERVKAVADKSNFFSPSLIVVNDENQASAFVLSNGNIYLSKRSLSIIYEGVSDNQAKTRLAFVLGHELSHLANNDFWDDQVSQAIFKQATAKEVSPIINTSNNQIVKELKADDQGFLYAALAGYQVDELLGGNQNQSDFLSFWIHKVGDIDNGNYPVPAQRTEMLKIRLKEKQDTLVYFNFGVRLAAFGHYDRAINFFKKFQAHFPSRELFTNMANAYLHSALANLDDDFVYHYWMPSLIDLETNLGHQTVRTANQMNSSSERAHLVYSPAIRENLIKATDLLQLAIEKDASYQPAYLNLAITQYFLSLDAGQITHSRVINSYQRKAKTAVDTAVDLDPSSSEALMLRAIVYHESGDPQFTTEILNTSKSSKLTENLSVEMLYNVARLSKHEVDFDQQQWQQVANQWSNLPIVLRQVLCRQSTSSNVDSTLNQGLCAEKDIVRDSAPFPHSLPIVLSRDLLENPMTAVEISQFQWQQTVLDDIHVYDNPQLSLVAVDDITSMLVFKKPTLGASTALIECCGAPLTRQAINGGELWHYGNWIGLVRENEVRELWISDH